MDKKIIAVITAVALIVAIIIVASFVACNDNNNPEETGNHVELPSESESGSGSSTPIETGNPGEYTYTDRNETVYVNNPNSAVTLRSATYEACGSIPHGTELTRTGLSTDEGNYWSKVVYNGETYYIASRFLTDINNPDEGFVACDKTVDLKDGQNLNIRNVPSMQSSVIGNVADNVGKITGIKVISENIVTGWYKIEYVDVEDNNTTKQGYIVSDAKYYVTANTDTNTEAGNNNTNTEGAPEGAGK